MEMCFQQMGCLRTKNFGW